LFNQNRLNEEEGRVITSIKVWSFSLDGGSWCAPGKYLLMSLHPERKKITNLKTGISAGTISRYRIGLELLYL
jgi:hypothetical protein